MIDDRQALRTPESAILSLVPAGPLPRAAAFFIDLMIRIPFYLLALILSAVSGGAGGGIMLIMFFLLEWFYPVVFELLRFGQTPGKKLLGLAVTHRDGTPVTLNGSLIRNLVRQADFFPLLYLTGFVAMLCNGRFQRLGDLAANTMVVYVGRDRPAQPVPSVTSSAPDWSVTLDDQQTLLGFAERHHSLSQERRQELASLGWPELPAAEAEQRALAVARYLRGQ